MTTKVSSFSKVLCFVVFVTAVAAKDPDYIGEDGFMSHREVDVVATRSARDRVAGQNFDGLLTFGIINGLYNDPLQLVDYNCSAGTIVIAPTNFITPRTETSRYATTPAGWMAQADFPLDGSMQLACSVNYVMSGSGASINFSFSRSRNANSGEADCWSFSNGNGGPVDGVVPSWMQYGAGPWSPGQEVAYTITYTLNYGTTLTSAFCCKV